MTSRKRKNLNKFPSKSESGRPSHSSKSGAVSRVRRQHLLETLESRQMLAGPQLIGVQPNEGALIVDGTVRDTAPRVLTFRFDENQDIDSSTFQGIQITRAGDDGRLGTADDIRINPGLVTAGDNAPNEVVVRFSDSLVDDKYRIEAFGFDDAGRGIVGVRNTDREFLVPRTAGQRSEVIDFELNLGALIESVVPQPVVRNADGTLTQNRNEIVVYFNEDPLFVENDPTTGVPTPRSAENPRHYQLLLTQDSVRTSDDVIYNPTRVVYDRATSTARLFFADDINKLPGVPAGGGTFRLRIGTAVDQRTDLILAPTQAPVVPSVTDDFDVSGLRVTFTSIASGENASGRAVRFERVGAGPATVSIATDGTIVFNLGNGPVSAIGLRNALLATPAASALIRIDFSLNGVAGSGGGTLVPTRLIGGAPLVLQAVGDTLGTSMDLGVFGLDDRLTSLVLSETISPQTFRIELPGGNDDPGHRQLPEVANGGLVQHLNSLFGNDGADITDGITEIAYNFQGVFAQVGTTSFLNQINERQKTRIREALELWSQSIGVQFRETVDSGITFALGNPNDLPFVPGTQLLPQFQSVLNATLRVDPTFNESAIVFSNQFAFNTAYGEDFTRKAMAGIGFLLGLEQTPELTEQTLMTLSSVFLNETINQPSETALANREPVFPSNYDVLHGQYLHRPESNDVDLYRFEVNLKDVDRVGVLTVETFAERLPDSSSLDTTLTLFQQQDASFVTDFNVGANLSVRFDAVAPGRLGNNVRLDIVRSDRPTGDTSIRITQPQDNSGNPISNGILIDMPRRGVLVPSVPIGNIVNAINNSPFASSIVRATIALGNPSIDVSGPELNYSPILLEGGGINQLSRNDDYFSEDSRIIAKLGAGVYYIGVAASGNNTYDPTLPNSGFGGLTQGDYDLNIKFEPQVDEVDVIRDLDSARVGVPGTAIDGDGDGVPGGVNNFWFQTRPLERILDFVNNGASIAPNQTLTIVGATGVSRTYEFVPVGQQPRPGNAPVLYVPGPIGSTPATGLAASLASAINSRSAETGVVANVDGTSLSLSGDRSIDLSNDFRGINALGRTIFVDKTAGPQSNGSLSRPFNNISNPAVPNAFGSTIPGDIVRIVGNGGGDNNIATEADNFSYKIGVSDVGGLTLEDGRTMNVPKGVTTMIDAGAILKLRGAAIGVGSSNLLEDRSGGALQVLGTPRHVRLSVQGATVSTTLIADQDSLGPLYSDGSVIFTSVKDRAADVTAAGPVSVPAAGDWGGLIYRRDVDQTEGRADLEDEGIFLQHVNHAQVRYGGSSNLLIDSVQQLVNPIQIFNLRPTITFNEVSFSADAAISASPDSFEETSFQSPRFQQGGSFTADYSRVGPAIHNNQLINNSINGLFIRVVTTPGTPPKELTLAGRLDDISVVHYVPENIVVTGTPGGSVQDGVRPDLVSTAFETFAGGTLAAGTYDYRFTFVDASGFESLAGNPSGSVTVTNNTTVRLLNLPPVPNASDYITRRLYRLDPASGNYRLIGELDATSSTFVDNGKTTQGVLDLTRAGIRGRLDASLVVDPGIVMKFRGTRLELGHGTQLIAEGTASNPIIFTSYADDRFGAGGTFDTNNDNLLAAGAVAPARSDWSGIYAAANSAVSLDFVSLAYGGGVSLLEGGQSRGFAALELQQATGRITNSRFEFNEDGQDGAGPSGRFGRLGVNPSTIFVRGSQPTIVNNRFIDNRGSIIDIDSDSMSADRIVDLGRQSGDIGRFDTLDDNFGPLIRFNRYENVATDNVANRQISGLEIRGGILTTESVWDDTDIAHVLFDSITVDNFHSDGGLRLISRPDESLVVKFTGAGSAFSPTSGTGLTATGTITDIDDRIGGSIQVIGLPGAPVVLTSFADDTIGAGLTPNGTEFTDTNGDSFGSRPEENDWRSVLFDQFSNDRNVDFILEQTLTSEIAPGLNGNISNAQVLGQLAPNLVASDEQLRLGFEVQGFLNDFNDVDNYSFTAEAGTRVWLDVDRTNFNLDTVVEILDANGNVLARSDNSFDEVAGAPLADVDPLIASTTRSLQGGNTQYTEFGAGGLYEDFGSTNPRDSGISLALPGNPGIRSVYFFRVRSASINPDDRAGGITKGGYRFQLRLREEQEFPGSVVRFADIRYSNHGVHVRGLMDNSPLLGEAQENEVIDPTVSNNDSLLTDPAIPGQRAQYLGNLLVSSDKYFSVGGALSDGFDIDFYQIDVDSTAAGNLQNTAIFDIDYAAGFSRPDTTLYVFYDPDGETGPSQPRLVLMGEDSSVLDDQAKPVTSQAIDLLTRGSISSGDPLIGPISLSEGTYYVAVVGDGQTANAILDPLTRRSPLESVIRIFEDHVGLIGGSTALPPREGALFDTAALPVGWGVTTQRASDAGHGLTSSFNGSQNAGLFPPSIQIEDPNLGGAFFNAQDLSAGDPLWALNPDENIGDRFRNTSQVIPHTTVNGTTINDVVDIYSFTVPFNNARVILDIDNGANPFQITPDDIDDFLPDNIVTVQPVIDPTSVDLKLQLFDSTFQTTGFNANNSRIADGQLGSLGTAGIFSVSTIFSDDPYIEVNNLPAGVYYIAVMPELTAVATNNGVVSFSLDVADRPRTGTYQLHVSVEGHPSEGGDPSNQSIRFDRSVPTSTISSNEFDLVGYGPDDLPRFYFNYNYRPTGTDSVVVSARSNENPTGSVLAVTLQPSVLLTDTWRQAIASLSDFAGHTGIVIEFTYNVDAFAAGSAEGLYLDDFIIGFAERGELVANALTSDIGFSGAPTNQAVPGEYQLEVRQATPYATPTPFGIRLDTTFDTNARHSESINIVAPFADQLADKDTFTLSDGVRTVRFEFDNTDLTDPTQSPRVVPGNVRIPFSATSSRAAIATEIRRAINLPVVQNTIRIQASDTTGSGTGSFGDTQVALSGLVLGDFIEVSATTPLPGSGTPLHAVGEPFRIPVVFNRGVGDENVERSQGQIIVEHNKISHVRAIGVYSEPGDRGTDPEDPVNLYLDRAPIGSTRPGAVRNLPTINGQVDAIDLVDPLTLKNLQIGGQTPGISVRNNSIDQAGMAGIKVEGEIRPFVIDSTIANFSSLFFGDFINDGLTMTVDAGDLRVVFEFEELNGAPVPAGGSGVSGGDGWVDGHVPVYYRRTVPPAGYLGRSGASTRHEVMLAIYDAIQSSILVTNDLDPLVKVTLGSSLRVGNEFGFNAFVGTLQVPNASVYIEGATNVQFTGLFQNVGGGNPFGTTGLAQVHNAPQPVSRIVNNTIVGEDGNASRFTGVPTAEPNDILSQAIDTSVGNAHTGTFTKNGVIGDSAGVAAAADVDLYRVFLGAGDRLTADIDTLAGGPDTVLRLFDSSGTEVLINQSGLAPDHLETSNNPDVQRAVDPFFDFTAREEGIYYVGVSSAANDSYDTRSISGRNAGTGGTGAYNIALKAWAPRSFVISLRDGAAENGVNPLDLVGTTFTVSQIPDFPTTGSFPANRRDNEQVFRFYEVTGANPQLRIFLNGANEVQVPIHTEFRVPDIMAIIAEAVDANLPELGNQPALPNHSRSNGPDGPAGPAGPIGPVTAKALGGADGNEAGLKLFPVTTLTIRDHNTTFGHNRGFPGFGSAEQYVLIERAAEVSISQGAFDAGLRLDPTGNVNIDQLYPETGILLTGGSSGTVVNNVLSNLHQGLVNEFTKSTGFFDNTQVNVHPKPATTIVTANVFQNIEPANNVFRQNMNQPFTAGGDIGLTPGPSNVNGGTDDFNLTLTNDDSLFVFREAGNFVPASDAIIIDSSVNSLTERDNLTALRQSIGLPSSNVLAPDRDVNGVLRADNPDIAPPGGLGSQVFKDRGSNELADFVGPVAIARIPGDNDAQGIDIDPASSVLRLSSGVYPEFRIQLRDTGDSSDPFAGIGIDDDTILVAPIDGLRERGANVTVFENDRLLVENIDYTFNYDATQKIITLTPLAGIWRNNNSYRISLNNKERAVLIAPKANEISDGDQLSVTDANGGTVVFEFESGFQLLVPEAITLIVPTIGTDAGGLRDGDVFQINDGVNAPVIFEFDSDGVRLPDSERIALPTTPTPRDPDALRTFLEGIAINIRDAINSLPDTQLNVDANAIGTSVVIGSEAGTLVTTSSSGLLQAVRTLGISVPDIGTVGGGITDGQVFTISNGSRTVTFEIDTNNNVQANTGNIPIRLVGALTGAEVAVEISRVVSQSGLNLTPSVSGTVVYMNLPSQGNLTVGPGQLTQVGISRTLADGDLITLTPNTANSTPVKFEINRSDVDSVVDPNNLRVDITRRTTADQLTAILANRLKAQTISGLDPNGIVAIPGGQLSIGGSSGLQVGLSPTTRMELIGAPSVTGPSTIQVFGPLLLNLPLIGGGGFEDGSVLILKDDLGNDEIFEFNIAGTPTLPTARVPGANIVTYNTFDNVDVFAANLVGVINAANIGITASVVATGRISLGRIDSTRLVLTGIPGDSTVTPPLFPIPGVPQITTRRGIVNDGERLTIRQGATSVTFEFDSVNNGGGVVSGNVPVAFLPGSTPGDVAIALAAAINNNRGSLQVSAIAERDLQNNPTGQVILNDVPGTVITLQAPTLNLIGVPGGAISVRISPAFSAEQIKQALLLAINGINTPGQAPVTNLAGVDRGGDTFFIENGVLFNGPLANYFLPAIADLAGNPLEANRQDQTTQFTILMPTVSLDFGDAPDPVGSIPGRYPTLFANNGPRHVVTPELTLGNSVDADTDGQPSRAADADDFTILASETGSLFTVSVNQGNAAISIEPTVGVSGFPFSGVEGNTITITTALGTATLEFDTDGVFNEDNFAIRPVDRTSVLSIAQAIQAAIAESPISPASVSIKEDTGVVTVSGDDEDGVRFTSIVNPGGVFNKGVVTEVEVSVRGAGIVDAWIDFNADGDFDDPNEQIIGLGITSSAQVVEPGDERPSPVFSEVRNSSNELTSVSRRFKITVPATTPDTVSPITTYARFRVSRDGGLLPTGLALSGEVEDYSVQLVPGAPPTISSDRFNQTFTGREDTQLQAISPPVGLLAGITDPNGDAVAIFTGDTGTRTLRLPNGDIAGVLTLNADGTFAFVPQANFNGSVTFNARVTDLKPTNPGAQLVVSKPLTVTLVVEPVNDRPIGTAPAIVNATINEDTPLTLDPATLFARFVPGPANESSQLLTIQSAGSSAGTFRSTLGGTIGVSADQRSITYTPPADLGGIVDTFVYTVADQPGAGQFSELAALQGTVSITVNSVNDNPTANNDNLTTLEDTLRPFTAADLLGNDLPGPSDEVNAGQVLSLAVGQFPKATSRGGEVRIQGNGFVYDPPALFSGVDTFTYTVVDSLGAMSTGTVSVTVGAVNNAPRFIGVNGDPTRQSLTFDESKQDPQRPTFNLSTWFNDPDNDSLTYSVTSQNAAIVAATVVGNELRLTLPPFQFGSTSITVTATDPSNLSVTRVIPVTVNNTPDAPTLVGSLDPLNATEDMLVSVDLRTVFNDPDRDPLQYSVSRLDNIVNPTATQIAANTLLSSISFIGDEMRIVLDPNQFGTADIELSVFDGTSRISTSFTLNVTGVSDDPVAVGDAYNIAIGSEFSVLNPALGLLRNDIDADGTPISVDVSSVTQPAFGNLVVNADGTFRYTNTGGVNGSSDQFSYRVVDGSGAFSSVVNVTLNFGASRYQNPLVNLASDVNADGRVTAVDALRIINLMNRRLDSNESFLAVSEIGAPPPDYVDVNGDGRVSAADALEVLRILRQQDIFGEGEQLSEISATSVTRTFATSGTLNLPTRVSELAAVPPVITPETLAQPRDLILAAGMQIDSISTEIEIDAILGTPPLDGGNDYNDQALTLLFGDMN